MGNIPGSSPGSATNSMEENYRDLFELLRKSINDFIVEIKSKNINSKVTDEWSVKEMLCHITFWHENYAVNYEAMATNQIPPLPEGMSTINMAGVLSLKKCATKELIGRLLLANESLYWSIVEMKVPRMTYSKGGRTYETADFLKMVIRHIDMHTKQVKNCDNLSKTKNHQDG